MGHDRAHFLGPEALQQSGAYGDQRVIAIPASGEGIGCLGGEDPYLRHADTGLVGQLPDSAQQPLLIAVAGLRDELHTRAAPGHPFGQEQRYHRAAETKNGAHDQQRSQVEIDAVGCEDALQPQQVEHDTEQYQYRQVGGNK